MTIPTMALEVRSVVTAEGGLEVSLVEIEIPALKADEVLLKVEAAPLNPSDLGVMFPAADPAAASAGGTAERPTISARVHPGAMQGLAARVGKSTGVGNEGAGTVVAAGTSEDAQALVGKRVTALGGGSMYATYRVLKVLQVRALPDGVSTIDGASAWVNPLTALGMVETMKREGHTALVHTAAASNLGQMLNRLCIADGIPLVNIVRKQEQVDLLRSLGATHVANSSAPTFKQDLVDLLASTNATIAFDAIGGGRLTSQILDAMEAVAIRGATAYSRYGSKTHKQVYVYGALDPSPTELRRTYGMAWSIGGWLVFPFLAKLGPERTAELEARVMRELTTTFASRYTRKITLAQALSLDEIARYTKAATGEKYLITPT